MLCLDSDTGEGQKMIFPHGGEGIEREGEKEEKRMGNKGVDPR